MKFPTKYDIFLFLSLLQFFTIYYGNFYNLS